MGTGGVIEASCSYTQSAVPPLSWPLVEQQAGLTGEPAEEREYMDTSVIDYRNWGCGSMAQAANGLRT